MMHSRPEMNQKNPPGQIIPSSIPYGPGMGQIKYLRDMIKKYHEEEGMVAAAKHAVELLKNSGVSEAFLNGHAPIPSTSAEKRSEGLVEALLAYCDSHDFNEKLDPHWPGPSTAGIRELIRQYYVKED
jgi:hypothetical protein